MKCLYSVSAAIILLSLAFGCSRETVNRRGEVAATMSLPGESGSKDGDVQTEPGSAVTSDLVGPALVEAKNNAGLTSEFKSGILLLSKVSANEIVLFTKDGNSWLYNPAAGGPPTALDPAVGKPQGFNLYTLPEGKFWLVGPQTLGRRKAGEVVDGAVPVENFNTSTIKGDWTKARVLYAAPDVIIVHLDTNIAILTVRSGTPTLSQFNSELPVALDGGAIVTAGETESGGYWFASKETVAVLETTGLKSSWTRARLPLGTHADYSQLAMRIDSSKKEVTGDVLIFQGDLFWSVSGAAIQ